jgi:hypothetical protein
MDRFQNVTGFWLQNPGEKRPSSERVKELNTCILQMCTMTLNFCKIPGTTQTLGVLLSTVTAFLSPPFWNPLIELSRAPRDSGAGGVGGGGAPPTGGGGGGAGTDGPEMIKIEN